MKYTSNLILALANFTASKQLLCSIVNNAYPKGTVVRIDTDKSQQKTTGFCGIGIVSHFNVNNPDTISVLLENGNTWNYCLMAIVEIVDYSKYPEWVNRHFGRHGCIYCGSESIDTCTCEEKSFGIKAGDFDFE